jgi:RNA polymerase sigma-70 factor, ECF subfamily
LAYPARNQGSQAVLRVLPAVSPASAWDDAELARALIEKRPAAAKVAWERFSPMVRRMIRRSLGPQHDVEDSVQDVFLCLFERVCTLREPQALKAFVIGITLRTLRYAIRRAQARRWIGLSRTAELPDSRVTHADNSSQRALIQFYQVLDRLRERDRIAFTLRFIEGMDAAEVAEAMGVSLPTARRAFTHAWERVTLLAQRDAFLSSYLSALPEAPVEASADVLVQQAACG